MQDFRSSQGNVRFGAFELDEDAGELRREGGPYSLAQFFASYHFAGLFQQYAGVLWFKRQWERAIEHCRKILELDQNFATMRWMLANLYQASGSLEEAIGERLRGVELSGGAPLFVAGLGDSYAAAGKRDEALRIIEELHQLSKHRYVMAYWMALIYAGLKENDTAFRWLETAREERSPMLTFVKMDPRVDNLRSDPRFDDLMRRMKLSA